MKDTTPSYNLKVVVRETGIKPATLRAWERRYDLPAPARTSGGHRLYSPRDLETIKWLLAREREGLRIGQAVQLWHELLESGQDPLQEALVPPPGAASVPAGALDDLAALREAWIQATLRLDEAGAEQQVAHALARHAPELVALELLQKGLAEIGHLWYAGQATVQQEHFASVLALRRVSALLAAAPPPTRLQFIYLACPPEEEHTFPLLLLTLLLRYRGLSAIHLGANVPLAQLETTVEAARPALFVLAAQTLPTAATALAMARYLQQRQVPLAYGGLVFNRLPALRESMPGFFLGDSLADAAARILEILQERPAMPQGTPLPQPYSNALLCFEQAQRLIAGHVWQIMQVEGMPEQHLRVANQHLEQGIRAALAFGNMHLLDDELAWVRQLLTNQGIPAAALDRYLHVYHQVTQEQVDDDCRPLLDWLTSTTSSTTPLPP